MTRPVQRVRAFDRRHPLWWDTILALALTAVSINVTPHPDPLTIAFLLVINGAVAFRRRRPFPSLLVALGGVVSAAVLASLTELSLPWAYLALWVLLFNVGLRDGGRRIVGIGAITVLAALAAFLAPPAGGAADVMGRLGASLPVMAMCLASFLAGAQLNSHKEALENRRRETARAAVIAERSRIAQEMHDIIGHNLSVITSLANGGSVAARRSPQDAVRAFEAIGEISRSSVREVQRVLAVLREDQSPHGASLSPQPGLDDIAALVESVRAAGAAVHLERAGDLRGLSAGRQLVVYRIVQESLTNVLRHGGSRVRVAVTIAREHDEVVLRVDDSGGTSADAEPRAEAEPGHGILGMRRRAEAYGGTVDAYAVGSGWRVRARIPLGQKNDR